MNISSVRHARTEEEQQEIAERLIRESMSDGSMSLSTVFEYMDDGGDIVIHLLRALRDAEDPQVMDYRFHFQAPKKHPHKIETYNWPDTLLVRNGQKQKVYDRKTRQNVNITDSHKRQMLRRFKSTGDFKEHPYYLVAYQAKDGVFSMGLRDAMNLVVSCTGKMDDSKESIVIELTQAELDAKRAKAAKPAARPKKETSE